MRTTPVPARRVDLRGRPVERDLDVDVLALREALRYTHGDQFAKLPGHITFTSHYHMAVAVDAMARQFQGVPEFVDVFKEMAVDAVHIADFHGDGHPKDPGPLRLPEVDAMNKECRRLSGENFLLLPGEEINEFLGITEPGKHPGHWMSLFPKPVYWIEKRATDQPFAEPHPQYGTAVHVTGAELHVNGGQHV